MLNFLKKNKTDPVGRTASTKTASRTRRDGWALKGVVDHVTFSGGDSGHMIAWYLAEPVTWSFRSVSEGEQLIYDQARHLAELVGTTIYCRVTTRPYPVHHWARTAYDNAPEPQVGFEAMMTRDQMHLSGAVQADKLVYFGVDLGSRGMAIRHLGKVLAGAVDREMQALEERLAHIDAIMAGSGLEASPVKPRDMEWLLARSFALGCPVPVPDPFEPERSRLTEDELSEFVNTTSWSSEPIGSSTKITTSVGDQLVERYVVVLTLERIADVRIPESHEPWMAKTDRLGFPVEWSYRVDPRAPEEISREMGKLVGRIDAQMDHWRNDHDKRPPKQLSRQADRAADVEDEMRSEFTGLATRTRGWYRVAVSGATEKEALERASKLQALYKPLIRFSRELGQYHLAREFVPGEPLASTAHARHFPVLKVAAALPAITAEVGDRRGVHIGETAGLVARGVFFDPHFMTEVMEMSGLVPVVGTPGSGKSMLVNLLTYKLVLSGVRGVAMDPAGRAQKMLALPEIARIARSVDLIGGLEGSLAPYAVVPDPNRALIEMDSTGADDFANRLRLAESAAQQARRDLAYETLRGSLPLSFSRSDEVQRRLRSAITSSPASRFSTAMVVVTELEKGDNLACEIAKELRIASQRELGRLFFHSRAHTPEYLDRNAEGARLTIFNLRGLIKPPAGTDMQDYTPEELLYRPIMSLASWSALQVIYRGDPHERKLFALDEAQEITEGSGVGRTLLYKLSSDSRKNNSAALVATQNASTVLGNDINNFVGAAFIGRTQDEGAQRDALKLLGKAEGIGYEDILGRLSARSHRDQERSVDYREFIYRDGLGGDSGRGGMEKIRVTLKHHPDLFSVLDTTADPTKRAGRMVHGLEVHEGGAA